MGRRRVLVTGGAGFVGAHTVKALDAAGCRAVVLDDLSTGHRWALRWGTFVEGSVHDRALVARLLREHDVEAVLHFAGSIEAGESMAKPGKYFRDNVVGALALLEAMVEAGTSRIVFSSSAAVYGEPERVPIPEGHRLRPINPYGESKLFVERMLHWFGDAHGTRWVALRYFNAAGADPSAEIGEAHDPESHLIPIVIGAALGRRGELEIYGADYPTPDGTAVRDYVHVSDLAEAHVSALRHVMDGGESVALNLGTGRGCSVLEVVGAVERVGGRTVPRRMGERRPGDPPSLVADPALAARVLGWKAARAELDAIVETAWRWHAGPGPASA